MNDADKSKNSKENGVFVRPEEERTLAKRTAEFADCNELPDGQTAEENGSAKLLEKRRMQMSQRRLTEFIVLSEETSCGIGCCRGRLLQRFANKKAYVILYGILGCIFSASYSYFNGTITTLEKRFKIPSKTTGTSLSLCRGHELFFGEVISIRRTWMWRNGVFFTSLWLNTFQYVISSTDTLVVVFEV